MSTSSTFGRKLGHGIGRAAATTAHGAYVAVSYTGRFGADVIEGTSESYTGHSERLAAQRAAMRSHGSIAMTITPRKARVVA